MRLPVPAGVRGEEGFTLIEVLVSAMVLVTGALGTVQMMISSARTELRAEQNDVATSQAESELERIHTIGFDQVALSDDPPSGVGGPSERLSGSCAAQGVSSDGCLALNDDGSDSAPLVVEGGALEDSGTVSGAAIDPGPDAFQVGDVTGKIYRYVVWQDDPSCHAVQCPGLQDHKRVAVVVTLDVSGSAGQRAYREIQSDVFDPDLGKDEEPTPLPSSTTVVQQFWPTDTTCDSDLAVPQLVNHDAHNTLGACSDGTASGNTPGAPDLLSPSPPQLDPSFAPEMQPEYDLATDVEPVANPGGDSGLQVWRGSSGCTYNPSGSDAHLELHRWVSAPMGPGFTFVLEGSATLELWTKTIAELAANGKICFWLFVRDDGVGGNPVDTLIGDASNGGMNHFTASLPTWPDAQWDVLSLPVTLQPPAGETHNRVLPGQRLGFAISVDASTSINALQFSYDHPDFATRLEVETSTPLPPAA